MFSPPRAPDIRTVTESTQALVDLVTGVSVLPSALLEQALRAASQRGDDADAVASALLTRLEVPLAAMEAALRSSTTRRDQVKVRYLARPEHTGEAVARMLAEGLSEDVLTGLVAYRLSSAQARAAALEATENPALLYSAGFRRSLDPQLRARALARLWDMLPPTSPPDPGRNRKWRPREEPSRAGLVDDLRRKLAPEVANALAAMTEDPALLLACALRVTDPSAADRVIELSLLVLGTGRDAPAELEEEDDLRALLLQSATRLSMYAGAPAREQLAARWEEAEAAGTLIEDNLAMRPAQKAQRVREAVALLRHADMVDLPWQRTRVSFRWGVDSEVAVMSFIAAELGEDAQAWAAFPAIAATFAGTVRELVTTVKAVASASPAA